MNKIKSLFIVFLFLMFLPIGVFASSYSTLNLEETFLREELEYDIANYKELEEQITIYMFRGQGCSYCRQFLTFLNGIIPEYGKYFKLVSFEVWHNKNNASLMENVADSLGQKISGVPFIVIGDKIFQGYHDNYDESIKEAIKASYENKKDYKDVVASIIENGSKNKNDTAITLIILFLIASAIGFLIYIGKEPREKIKANNEKKEEKISITNEKAKKKKITSKKNPNQMTKNAIKKTSSSKSKKVKNK